MAAIAACAGDGYMMLIMSIHAFSTCSFEIRMFLADHATVKYSADAQRQRLIINVASYKAPRFLLCLELLQNLKSYVIIFEEGTCKMSSRAPSDITSNAQHITAIIETVLVRLRRRYSHNSNGIVVPRHRSHSQYSTPRRSSLHRPHSAVPAPIW